MGKSSKPTIGYWHQMGVYTGECFGPADALRAIEAGGEMAWEGNQTTSGSILINKPELWGGEKKEGGIVGTLEVRMGEATQTPNAYLQSQVPGPWPAARGIVTTVFDGTVGAMNPYLKLWKKRWSRWTAGWNTAVWEPALAKIGEGMNPAHIIYQVITDPNCAGYPTSAIDTTSFLEAAQTLSAEDFGLCLKWSRSTSTADFLRIVCDHMGGQWSEDPSNAGKITLRLFRKDYDPDTLPLLDESNIIKMESWITPTLEGSINEVIVVGRDCLTDKDIVATYQNLASVQAQGRIVSKKMQMPGLWKQEQCARVAARECHAESSLLIKAKVRVKRSVWGVKRGDVYALSWKRKNAVRIPMRVLDVDEGTMTDTSIGLTLMQDASGLEVSSYILPVATSWTAPDTVPQPVAAQKVIEASYRDLVATMRAADLAQVGTTEGFVVAFGARPTGPSINYTLSTRVGTAAYVNVASGDFTPTGLLQDAITPTTTTLTLLSGRGLDLVKAGEEAMIDDEIVRVDAVNPTTGAVTIARGCVDTIPAAHAANARMWFAGVYFGADPTEYSSGETVDAKLLPRTSQGVLDSSLATAASVTLNQRQYRPYPPAKLRINGAAYPPAAFAKVATTWVHRDRLLQQDQVVDTESASIGPEAGVTYTQRIYQEPSTLLNTQTGITGTAAADYIANFDGSLRIELEAVRGGLVSLFKHTHVLTVEGANKLANGTFAADTDWTKGTGWAIAAGVATKTAGTASDLNQAEAFVAGGQYLVEYTLSGVTGGTVKAQFAGGTAVNGAIRSATGSYSETLTALTGNDDFRLVADAAFAGSVDDVSVRRVA